MTDHNESNGWSKLTKIVIGLTGVLVVVPALINSARDVYYAINQLPRSDVERSNEIFFKKYWGKDPLGKLPVVISRNGIAHQFNVNVYQEGDLSVQFGDQIQWFAFPEQRGTLSDFGFFIPSAFAEDIRSRFFDVDLIRQTDSLEGRNAIRENIYKDGSVERQVIDVRTGVVVDRIYKIAPNGGETVIGSDQIANPALRIDLDSPDPKFRKPLVTP